MLSMFLKKSMGNSKLTWLLWGKLDNDQYFISQITLGFHSKTFFDVGIMLLCYDSFLLNLVRYKLI